MPPDRNRLQGLIVVTILLGVVLTVVYNAGVSRGRLNLTPALMTSQAGLTSLPTADIVVATPTPPLLAILPSNTPTPTDSPTPTETPTPTASPTSTNTATPTQTPTPTATPASPQEWAQRYEDLAVQALNELPISDFSPQRAQALLRRLAQEQGLTFVPAAHFQVQGPLWAALVVPRTPQDQALPMLFWREPNDFNRIRSQLLLDELSTAGNTPGVYDYSRFYGGVHRAAIRQDYIGRLHVLLVEHPDAYPRLSAHVLTQTQPAGSFTRLWTSSSAPFWTQRATGSQVQLVDTEASVLPDIEIYAPLDRGTDLRRQVGAGEAVQEQTPFARQWAQTRWRYITVEGALDLGGVVEPGYNLQMAELSPTPLTTVARFLELLQAGNVSGASEFSTRFDLMQEAFNLGLGEPGEWLAYYIDDAGQPLFGGQVSQRLQLFDNRDRNRTYLLTFEGDGGADAFRISGVTQTEPYLSGALVTPVPPAAGGAELPGELAVAPGAPEPMDTPTPTAVPTETGTPTPTLTPEPTATTTATATDTPGPTDTPLPTDTPTPGPVPAIPAEETTDTTAIVFRSPANLRGGPDTSYGSVAQLGYGVTLDLFGMTEVGNWVVVRITDPAHPQAGELGWIALDLLQMTAGNVESLPRYSVEGLALVPPTPGPTPTPAPPEPTPTPTPRTTPVLSQPGVSPLPDLVSPPGPGGDEQVYTLTGDAGRGEDGNGPPMNSPNLPANPFQAIGAVGANGAPVRLAIDGARVEIWSGAFGVSPPDWTGAPAELLWPNTEVYVVGEPDPMDPARIVVQRIRIARPPSQERVRLAQVNEFAAALNNNVAVALMGSREEPGVYLLETEPGPDGPRAGSGALRQLWVEEQQAQWLGPTPSEGVVVSTAGDSLGRNWMTWVRGDGQAVRITAQPYHALQGVAGDSIGGLWWIERPQVDLDQWQLWHYDPMEGQIRLRLRGTGRDLGSTLAPTTDSLSPLLLGAQPVFASDTGVVTGVNLLLDSYDGATQRLYTGVYRAVLRFGANGLGELAGNAQLLLAAESYRGPLLANPTQTRLAYFIYDPEHPSLTSGFIQPSNTVRVLSLDTSGAVTIRTVYASENRFEFLAPNLAWLDADRLIVARSRFAAGEMFALDRFGITQIRLPASSTGAVEINSYLFPNQRELRDFAVCRDDEHVLAIVATENNELELARWDGEQRPISLFLLPPNQTRTFLCWQAPDALVDGP